MTINIKLEKYTNIVFCLLISQNFSLAHIKICKAENIITRKEENFNRNIY